MSETERETMNAVAEGEPDPTTADRYESLAAALRDTSHVAGVTVHESRSPPRVEVELTTGVVPPSVEDLLGRFGAVVHPESMAAGNGRLSFEVSTPERFKTAANHAVRPHGTSLVVTLTRESLDLSGFEEGTELDQRAREGAVLLTPREE